MISSNRALGFHYLIRSVIVLSFSILITYLIKSGNINLYIAPRMLILVKLSAIGFYVIGMYQMYSAYRYLRNQSSMAVDCDCDHTPTGSVWKHIMIYSLFVFPLLLGFLLPNATMGTALASKKGMNLSASTTSRTVQAQPEAVIPEELVIIEPSSSNQPTGETTLTEEQLNALFVTDEYNEDFARLSKQIYQDDVIVVKDELFMEILTAIDLFLDSFTGKKVEISGFVYREPDMNQNQFVVGRFAMDCCSADALPYGVLVEDASAAKYKNDSWIKVRGQIETTVYEGNEIMVFKPESIESITAPESPYIYPNYDF
ncbi:MAG: TIGR03943 family protein [Paenibacillaceae bacterium]